MIKRSGIKGRVQRSRQKEEELPTDKVHSSENRREAESEADMDNGPAEAEDYARSGPAGLEVRVGVQEGNNGSGND